MARRIIEWFRRHTLAADALLALGVLALDLSAYALADPFDSHAVYRDRDVAGAALVILGTVPLAWRRRNPPAVLATVGTAAVAYQVAGYPDVVQGIGVLIALYTVAAHCSRRASRTALVATAGALALILATARWAVTPANVASNIIVFFTVWLVGENLRTRWAHVAGLEERARWLEAEQEALARQAVEDERASIARELHDVVAHAVSVMVVQAGAARRVVERDPAAAREAIVAIESTGRTALDELRRLLGVLRPGDTAADTRAPQPSLRHVNHLVAQLRDAGLDVELRVDGEAPALPSGIDLSAYRILQEALTNVLKHAGPAHAVVEVRYRPDAVELHVVDDGRGIARALERGGAPGHGLVGMRERAALFGGELRAGPRVGGGYAVFARLPLEGVRA